MKLHTGQFNSRFYGALHVKQNLRSESSISATLNLAVQHDSMFNARLIREVLVMVA